MNILEEIGITQEMWDGPKEPLMDSRGLYILDGVHELTSEQYWRIRAHNRDRKIELLNEQLNGQLRTTRLLAIDK